MTRGTWRALNGAQHRVNSQKIGRRDIIGEGPRGTPIASKPDTRLLLSARTSAAFDPFLGTPKWLGSPRAWPWDAFVAEATC